MNVLLIGSGGREHALAWAISASPLLGRLVCAPGNAGIAEIADCVSLDSSDHAAVTAYCQGNAIDFVVVGPEMPLVAGLVDDLAAAGIRAFGPSKAAARLEGSKSFTKELCDEAQIPTAAYWRFEAAKPAIAHIREREAPIVVKADGLAAGKGVTVATTAKEAEAAVRDIFSGRFGADTSVVVEDLLVGEEASFFALCDGKTAVPFGTAQDHKRVGDGDTGPNTGGMGAYSPAPIMTEEMCGRVMREIVEPTLKTMAERRTPFVGVLYTGLMISPEGPKLIEYNVRFGDPECQVLMPRLKDDILTLMLAAVDGTLDKVSVRWWPEAALTVVMAAKGYPGDYRKGSEIKAIEQASALDGVDIFHAGTKREAGRLLAHGGRVLNVSARGHDIAEAQRRAYMAVKAIDWPEGFYRSDIGWRAIGRVQ